MKLPPQPTPIATFFFFNDTATTEIYTLSLHDALPISGGRRGRRRGLADQGTRGRLRQAARHSARVHRLPRAADRKSTRLNSSHSQISYAVFCLKKTRQSLSTSPNRPSTQRS